MRSVPWLYGAAVTLSAFLLFAVQPFAGRLLLPRLGGAPAVWTACLLFFQATLLVGYGWGWLSRRISSRTARVGAHVLLLATAALALPPLPPSDLRELTGDAPTLEALVFLARTVGLPFLALSTTAPMLQAWLAESTSAARERPYVLYAASNAGSLVSLLVYPPLIEPLLGLGQQATAFSIGFVALVVLVAVCGAMLVSEGKRPERDPVPTRTAAEPGAPTAALVTARDTTRERVRWVVLSLVPSALLTSVTSYVSMDLAPMPLLWVAPLAIYLLTFVVAFRGSARDAPTWASRVARLLGAALVVATGVHANSPLALLLILHLAFFGLAAFVVHRRLARAAPEPGRLTEFYVHMALGGVLGTLLMGPLATALLPDVWEYPLGIAAACALTLGPSRAHTVASRDAAVDARASEADHETRDARAASQTGSEPDSRRESGAGTDPRPDFDVRAARQDDGVRAARQDDGVRAARNDDGVRAAASDVGLRGALGAHGPQAALVLALTVTLALGITHTPLSTSPFAALLVFGPPVLVAYRQSLVPARYGLCLLAIVVGGTLFSERGTTLVRRERDFFGVLRVVDDAGTRVLLHGTTLHGAQALDAMGECEPLAYYARTGPLGRAIEAYRSAHEPGDVSAIGLGAGSVACYALPEETWTFSEISLAVVDVASDPELFTYLEHARGHIELRVEDGRLGLRATPPGSRALVLVDAFSSDAVPAHLLTREAVRLYLRALRPGGWILLHVSNRSLDLVRIVSAVASAEGLAARVNADASEVGGATGAPTWIVLAADETDLAALDATPDFVRVPPSSIAAWTDDRASLWSALR